MWDADIVGGSQPGENWASTAWSHQGMFHFYISTTSYTASPQHEIHQLKPFTSEKAVTIGGQHEAGTQSVKQVLHHLLLFSCGRVVTLEYLEKVGGRTKEAFWKGYIVCTFLFFLLLFFTFLTIYHGSGEAHIREILKLHLCMPLKGLLGKYEG